MELIGIRTARVMVYVPLEELNPFGRALIPSVVTALIERYGFLAFPQNLGEYDETKGVEFGTASWNEIAIDRMIIYSNGVLVDTRSSTDKSEEFLRDALSWLAQTIGVKYNDRIFNRKGYLSEVIVQYERPLTIINPKLSTYCGRLSERVSGLSRQRVHFELSGVALSYDPLTTKLPIATMRIERLLDTPFEENKYYAVAPLPTAAHLEMLADFEQILHD